MWILTNESYISQSTVIKKNRAILMNPKIDAHATFTKEFKFGLAYMPTRLSCYSVPLESWSLICAVEL